MCCRTSPSWRPSVRNALLRGLHGRTIAASVILVFSRWTTTVVSLHWRPLVWKTMRISKSIWNIRKSFCILYHLPPPTTIDNILDQFTCLVVLFCNFSPGPLEPPLHTPCISSPSYCLAGINWSIFSNQIRDFLHENWIYCVQST